MVFIFFLQMMACAQTLTLEHLRECVYDSCKMLKGFASFL